MSNPYTVVVRQPYLSARWTYDLVVERPGQSPVQAWPGDGSFPTEDEARVAGEAKAEAIARQLERDLAPRNAKALADLDETVARNPHLRWPSTICESGWTGDRCTFPVFHDGPHSNESSS